MKQINDSNALSKRAFSLEEGDISGMTNGHANCSLKNSILRLLLLRISYNAGPRDVTKQHFRKIL